MHRKCDIVASTTAITIGEIEEAGGHISTYDDIYSGSDYIATVNCGDIPTTHMLLILSINGAQFYF